MQPYGRVRAHVHDYTHRHTQLHAYTLPLNLIIFELRRAVREKLTWIKKKKRKEKKRIGSNATRCANAPHGGLPCKKQMREAAGHLESRLLEAQAELELKKDIASERER